MLLDASDAVFATFVATLLPRPAGCLGETHLPTTAQVPVGGNRLPLSRGSGSRNGRSWRRGSDRRLPGVTAYHGTNPSARRVAARGQFLSASSRSRPTLR